MEAYWKGIVTLELDKKIREEYLVKAVSPTDAETKIANKFDGSGIDFEVTKVEKTKIVEVIE